MKSNVELHLEEGAVLQGGAKTVLRDVRFENVDARIPAVKDMRYVEGVVVK